MSVLDFLNQVADEKDTKSGERSGDYKPAFINMFMMSEENEKYIFSVIDMGVQTKSHQVKWPDKPKLCRKAYYGEDCEECEKDSTFGPQTRKKKNKEGVEETYEVIPKQKPVRKQHTFLYLHNHTGASKPKKSNPDETYSPSAVVLSDWSCGEANTQNGLDKDRNISSLLQVKDLGCLETTVFEMSRKKIKNDKGDLKNVVSWPKALPEKAKIKYKIPGIGEVENLVSKLVVPSDIQKKYDDMTIGEKTGLILTIFDEKTVDRAFWESKGVVFPKEQEAKPADDSKEEPEDL